MSEPRPSLYDLLPSFEASGDPATDLQVLGDWIEIVEAVLRSKKYVQVGTVTKGPRTYAIRVNGREYEAPHVHITIGSESTRVFLGATSKNVAPDNNGDPPFNKVIGNRAARRLVLAYVEAHHACLLQAWSDHGNPLHAEDEALAVVCQVHDKAPVELVSLAAEGLDAYGDERYRDLHSSD